MVSRARNGVLGAARRGGLALALALVPGVAGADVCRLLLDVETDAAEALEGELPEPQVRAARIAEIGDLAMAHNDLRRELLALSLAYRAAEVKPGPVDLAVALRRAASELRWRVPVCDVPALTHALDGQVLTPRPPATAARAPQAIAAEAGATLPLAPRRDADGSLSVEEDERQGAALEGDRRAMGRTVALVLAGAVLALWAQWFLVVRPAGARRHPCRLPVVLRIGERQEETLLEDISLFGARLRLKTEPVEIGDLVEIGCAQFTRVGRVQWANATYAGLRFRRPLRKGVMEACLAEGPVPERALPG